MDLEDKRILITGGTSGIGLETAMAVGHKGASVFVTGRREDGLRQALETLRLAGARAKGIVADVATPGGRGETLDAALSAMGGLDILMNNAGGVRAGRLEAVSEAEIRAMVEVDLVAPILLTRAALPALRASGEGLIVNVSSGIALVGTPFYATYAAVKAGLAHFGEALRRELQGEGIGVLTVYPGATDTPMMRSSRAGPDVGVNREPAADVAAAIVDGIETGAIEVVRGGETRRQMVMLNRTDPQAVDRRFGELKDRLAEAVKDHSAL
ncbi:MAG TPA: SDR family oxidoreductase [Caulobacteraceae bacterium]|jgi:short-subunit dehydrogenase